MTSIWSSKRKDAVGSFGPEGAQLDAFVSDEGFEVAAGEADVAIDLGVAVGVLVLSELLGEGGDPD